MVTSVENVVISFLKTDGFREEFSQSFYEESYSVKNHRMV